MAATLADLAPHRPRDGHGHAGGRDRHRQGGAGGGDTRALGTPRAIRRDQLRRHPEGSGRESALRSQARQLLGRHRGQPREHSRRRRGDVPARRDRVDPGGGADRAPARHSAARGDAHRRQRAGGDRRAVRGRQPDPAARRGGAGRFSRGPAGAARRVRVPHSAAARAARRPGDPGRVAAAAARGDRRRSPHHRSRRRAAPLAPRLARQRARAGAGALAGMDAGARRRDRGGAPARSRRGVRSGDRAQSGGGQGGPRAIPPPTASADFATSSTRRCARPGATSPRRRAASGAHGSSCTAG